MFKKIRQVIEFTLVVCIVTVARVLPSSWLSFFGKALGAFAYYCVPIRKRHAIQSLQTAFPEKDSAEIHAIVYGVYQNLGRVMINHCFCSHHSAKDILAKVEFVGIDILKKALAQNKGVIVTSGHLGDWETLGIALATAGYPISLVVAPIRNPYLNNMITENRKRMGVRLISKKGMAVRHITRDLKENRCVGMLIDQDAGRSGTFVNFFGRPSSTPKGPAQYALKRDIPIIMIFSFPQDDGRVKMVFEEIEVPSSEDQEEAIQQITQQMTSRLEYYIRQNPGNWFGWLHRRWKTKPPSAE